LVGGEAVLSLFDRHGFFHLGAKEGRKEVLYEGRKEGRKDYMKEGGKEGRPI
jgi:hypothetical protein